MAPDQANDLRQLVLRAGRVGSNDTPPPKIVVVAGGKGGVGTTTVAVNMAVALGREGRRVVLVDADFAGPDVAALCGLNEPYGSADVLAGRRTVHEVLQRGPGGIQVLPSSRGLTDPADCTPAAQERLIEQLRSLGPHADYVLIDAGAGAGRVMRQFWETADLVLLVTHADTVAVMDAYAAVKLVCRDEPPSTAIAVLTNCVADEAAAGEVHERIDRACRRFLGLHVADGGWIPFDSCAPRASAAERPLVVEAPASPAAAALVELAKDVPRRLESESPLHVHFRPQAGRFSS